MQLQQYVRVVGGLGLSKPIGKAQLKSRVLGPAQRMVIRRMASAIIHPPRDPNTLSNYNNFVTTHTVANFDIDFKQKRLAGFVKLDLKSVTHAQTKQILLDTSFLNVSDVKVHGKSSKWALLSRFEPYGSALEIRLDEGVEVDKIIEVDVRWHMNMTISNSR